MLKISNQNEPYAYFLTFTTYGNWLPGDERYSISRKSNIFGTKKTQPSKKLHKASQENQKEKSFHLNSTRRKIILNTTKHVCEHYNWTLLAAHIRSNHAHIVIRSDRTPEFAVRQIKAYCTRHICQKEKWILTHKVWARHASTRYIWKSHMLPAVIKYVVEEQGEKMAYYCHEEYKYALECTPR